MSRNLIILNCYNGSCIPTHPPVPVSHRWPPREDLRRMAWNKAKPLERESQSDPPYQTQKIFDRDEYIPILSRRHFSERRGTELTVRPAKKLFIDKKYQENIEDKPCGLRRVNLNNTITKIQYDKKHFAQRFGIENDPEILHIKTFHPDGNCLSMIETPIEKEFGIKKKLWSLTERRNGMELRIPGDKYYKASEHLSDFFKEGGLSQGQRIKLILIKRNQSGVIISMIR